MALQPNQEIRLRLSAYLGNILRILIFGSIILAFSNEILLNMGNRSYYGNKYGLERFLLFLGFIIVLLIYILRIRRTIVTFGNDGILSVESGYLGNSIKSYPLYHLSEVSPRQGLWNRLTNDGKLILKFSIPDQRGYAVNKTLVLKGLSTWKEIKSLSSELNAVIQQKSSGAWEQPEEELTA